MSSKTYQEAYSSMTEKQRDIMHDLWMKAENHDGHAWNRFCDIEDAVAGIVKEQIASAKPDVPDTNVGDMISRQAAIAEIMEDLEDRSLHDDPATPEDYAEGYDEGIRNAAAIVLQMPSAQPGWTYIEEELPKTIINKHTHDFQEYNCLCDFGEYGFDVRTYKFGNGHFWNGGGTVDKYVTAWQPLPEIPDALKQKPWEGEQDG